ncbi:glycosyltransferase family 39 protein [Candidatus Woesearchaeota archaeon]|nr:glycosyltransferase family 39 protein [Candidatus Woesearchaeota archaeon]
MPGNRHTNIKKHEIVILATLVFCAIFLRAYNLNDLSGGDDSAWAQATFFIIQNPENILYPTYGEGLYERSGWTMPRFFGIFPPVITTLLFGHSSFAMMLPSIVFAALSTILIFLILRLQFNRKIGLLGSALFTFSPLYIGFTRIATFDSQLIATLLLAIYLYMLAVERNDNRLFYLAAAACVVNFMTTEIRGLVPIVAILPYLLLKHLSKDRWKHILLSTGAAVTVYSAYIFLPLAFGYSAPADNLIGSFIHGAGQRETSANYLPLSDSVRLLGSYLFFTPFAMLLFVPMLFGIGFCIKKTVKPDKKTRKANFAFWLTFIASSAIFYLQGQPYPQRQTIYTISFAALAAIGIYSAYTAFLKRRNTLLAAMISASVLHMILFMKWFPTIFPAEYSQVKGILGTIGVAGVFERMVMHGYTVFIVAAIALSIFTLLVRRKHIRAPSARLNIANTILTIFILANTVTAFALVITGIGIYSRPDAILDVAEYIKANSEVAGHDEYLCVAGVHENSLIYYTQSLCAFWPLVDVNWLDEQSSHGSLRFFVIEKYYDYKTPGFGDIDEMRKDITANPHTEDMSLWNGNYADKYTWLTENTVDVTEQAGLAKGNPYFEVYQYREQQRN